MSAQQQDPLAIAPNIYRVLFENDRVRMLEITMKPGDKSALHYHPDNLNYVVAGGKARMVTPDGSMELEIKSGDPVWQSAGFHSVENTGGAGIQVIMVELKR